VRIATAVLALLGTSLLLASCGGDAPESFEVEVKARTEEVGDGAATDPGAHLDVTESGIAVGEVTTTTTLSDYDTDPEARAVSASSDMVPAFFNALRDNDLEQALSFASGNALILVDAIKQNARCGVRIVNMTSAPPTTAKSQGLGLYRTDANATLEFNTGAKQTITGVVLSETKSGGFLVNDFEVGDVTLLRLLDTGRGADRSKSEVRVDTVDMCIGPERAFATFNVLNDSNGPIRPEMTFFRKTNGELLPVTQGAETILGQEMKPGDSVVWTFTIEGTGLWNGSVVMIAPDLEGKPNGDKVERAWQFVAPPFFSGAL
jgi:hypothetical protein